MLILSYHQEQIKHCCYILHDQDVKDDGTLKEKHFHVVIETYNAYHVGAVRRWFKGIVDHTGEQVNTLCQSVIDRHAVISYLNHENRKDKHQYPRETIVNYNEALLIANEKPRNDDEKALLILDDLIAGVPEYQMCRRYGREYIMNAKKYREAMFYIMDDDSLPTTDKEIKRRCLHKFYYVGR